MMGRLVDEPGLCSRCRSVLTLIASRVATLQKSYMDISDAAGAVSSRRRRTGTAISRVIHGSSICGIVSKDTIDVSHDMMSPAEGYRKKAAEFRALAKAAQGTPLAVQLDQLARSYVRLAEQADANARTDIAIETGKKSADGS